MFKKKLIIDSFQFGYPTDNNLTLTLHVRRSRHQSKKLVILNLKPNPLIDKYRYDFLEIGRDLITLRNCWNLEGSIFVTNTGRLFLIQQGKNVHCDIQIDIIDEEGKYTSDKNLPVSDDLPVYIDMAIGISQKAKSLIPGLGKEYE